MRTSLRKGVVRPALGADHSGAFSGRRAGPPLPLPVALALLPFALLGAWMFAFAIPFFYPIFAFLVPVALMGQRHSLRLGLQALALLPPVFAFFLVPFRLVAHGIHYVLPAVPLDLFALATSSGVNPPPFAHLMGKVHELRMIDWWLGGWGLAMAVVGAYVSWFRNLRVARQIDNLPTSKVRAAALGLAEFRGVARTHREGADANAPILLSFEPHSTKTGQKREVLQPFYLEDDTGRIRVESSGAEFGHPSLIRFLEPIRFMYLTRHVEVGGAGVEQRLMPGDPVFLIGSVEEAREAHSAAVDADRLVVRPSSDWVKPTLLQRLVPKTGRKVPGGDIHHVFFLSDTSERAAADMMRETVWKTWKAAVVWVAMSGVLLWVAWPR